MPATALPAATAFTDASVTEGGFKTAITDMRSYLSWLFGTTGDKIDLANHGQIKFPATQNPSSDGNTLDDYEEGSFTPTLTAVTSGSVTTYNYQEGRYVKIGKLVWVHGIVGASNIGTATGNVRLSGLPFTSSNSGSANGAGGGALFTFSLATSDKPPGLLVALNQTYADVSYQNSGVDSAVVFGTHLANGSYFRFNFCYLAAN
jgi:hypothetical protein